MGTATSEQIKKMCRVCAAFVVLGAASVQAQTTVFPGTTTVLDITTSTENCFKASSIPSGVGPVTTCSADADATDQPLMALAASGLSSDLDTFFGQTVVSIATLSQNIQIPFPTSGAYSSVLPVQVATEVIWSGGTVVAGLDSTFAQIVATFQIRDVTNVTTNDPGPVVASNTFLFERTDADFEIIIPDSASDYLDFLNLIDIVDISNSSGADITALLERGRIYAIEVEVKCDVQVPIFGFGACLFSSDVLTALGLQGSTVFTAVADDGFSATDITVTVGSDVVEELLGSGGN